MLLAVGLGSFFIVGVRSLQENLVARVLGRTSPPTSPDMFLLDIQQDQVAGVRGVAGARQQPGAARRACCRCCARASSASQGREVTLENYEDVRGRGSLAREYTITYRRRSSATRRVIDGRVLGARRRRREAAKCRSRRACASASASRSATRCASTCWAASIEARVTSVRHVDWRDSRAGGFMFVFRPGLLEQAPHGFIAFLRGPQTPADARAAAGDAGRRAFPNVSVIDGREMLDGDQGP